MSEDKLIELVKSAGALRDDVAVGIGDDAAVLDMPAGRQLVSCVDALVAKTHFPESIPACDVGWRALAVNLSDFAAMGAEPRWATLVLSLPEADTKWVTEFAHGFSVLANEFQVALVGGDTVRGPLSIAVQLMGIAATPGSLLRSGARVGDEVWVSGFLGDAAAGLAIIEGRLQAKDAAAEQLCSRFLRPSARVKFGQGLVGLANAAIDLSDGLYTDAGRLALASGVGLEIDMARLPISAALQDSVDRLRALDLAAVGGDDYELLFTAAPDHRSRIESLAASLNMSCTRIGIAVDGQTVTCVLESERWMPSYTGFDHFAIRGDL